MNNKKILKKFLSFILSFVLIFTAAPFLPMITAFAASSSVKSGDCLCTLNGTILTISGNGKMQDYNYYEAPWAEYVTEVIIKSGVTSIGKYAFWNCKGLKSVSIPDSIASIGESAFCGCTALEEVNITNMATWCNVKFRNADSNPLCYAHDLYLNGELLTNLIIPDGVTSIGDFAFSGCTGLTSITVPDTVTGIGKYAYLNCKGLKSVSIPDSIASIGEYAFDGCTALEEVNITNMATWCNVKFENAESNPLTTAHNLYLNGKLVTNLVIPDGVTSIGDYAFNKCTGLTSITIPDSVANIGDWAFSGCTGLISVTIPNSVTSIGWYAFFGCTDLKKVYIDDVTKWCNINFNNNIYSNPLFYAHDLYLNGELLTNLIILSDVANIGDYAFNNCTGLTSITIPDGVTSIGNFAFYGCTGLISITIPDSVTSIGNSAFYGCIGLVSIKIPNGLTSIEYNTFSGCAGLTSITIPDSVTNIGNSAFSSCAGLTNIIIPNSITSISQSAFFGCSGLISVTIPDSVTSIGNHAFRNCTRLTNVTIPNNVISIGDYAFNNCTGLKSITIPNSVTSIGTRAFYDCTELTSVTISDSVTSRAADAFSGCKIKELNIAEGSKTITSVMVVCKSTLEKVTIPNSVTGIDNSAFRDCTVLTDITIPDGVTSIGGYAFSGCTGLASIILPNSITSIGGYTFSGCTGLVSVAIPNSVTSIGSCAFNNCTRLTDVTIPNSVTSIDGYAFSGCTGLTNIIIPDSITSISYSTFSGCTGLTSIIIPDGVTSIGDSAFFGCKGLTSIIIPNSVTSIGTHAFSGCAGLKSITIPDSVKSVGQYGGRYAFSDCEIKELNIAEGSKEVTSEMIVSESTLEKVTIPDSVENIGDTALSGCTKLTEITIPDSVKAIGKNAFSGCTGLEKVYITDMAAWCNIKFSNSASNPLCYAHNLYLNDELLTNIVISNGVASIGNYAFSGCTDIVSINIPSSVTSIDKDSFSGVDKSRFIIYTDSISSAAYKYANDNAYICRVFVNDAGNINFLLEDNVLRVFGTGKTPNYNLFTSTPWYDFKDNITKIIIDKSITEIGTYSFYGFDNLKIIETENPNLKFNTRSINTGNKNISVYSTGSGTLEEYCNNNSVNFVKPLESPILKTVTENTVEVQNEDGLEYSLDRINWQESGIFKELKPVTQYTVYVRWKNGYTPFEGKPLVVTTTKRTIAAPSAPSVESYTENSVTLISGYEYSLDGINWQKSNVFSNLSVDRIYTLYQRTIETDTDFNSRSSEPLYFCIPGKPEIIKIGATTLAVKEIGGYEYSLDKIDWQSSAVFTGLINNMDYTVYQRISKSLYPNSYQIVSEGTTVCVNGSDKVVPNAPSVPELKGKTVNSVTLKEVDGYEYRMNDGEWQKSNVFTGLNDDTEYTFYQRIAETETAYASENSLPLKVKTEKIHTPDDTAGHEWSEWMETKPASCIVNGEEQRSCLKCGRIETKILNSLGHDLKHTDAKAATCTESGYAAYDTCQREGCGYTTYEEIPATGHKKGEAVTENRTEPTCTKDGSYDSVVYCDVCKAELSRETKIIPALGHTYGEATVTAPEYGKEGYSEHECTVCGYKEKFDFTEALKYPMGQTLVFEDGVWKYVSDGRLAPEYTGLVEYYGTWYYVENGILNWGYTGLTNYYGTWYYVEGGILNWSYSGLTNFYGTWYYVDGGILNWGYTGLTNFYGTWYYVDGGILNWGYTGLTNFYGTWYYVDGGILNWGYTGLTNYYGTWYYVANGVLDWNYTGSTYYYGTWYYVQGGVLR